MRILCGTPSDGHFAAVYGHHGRVVGVLGWNAPRQVRVLRRPVVVRAPWTAFTARPALRPAIVN
ncbi:hypothetical protein ACFZCP_07875 [Streptomyces sp. NPDC007971]|uniref:hypothetical protein n=1 Tax=Streptomyces sp. NPDC007971 TaxID=3364799 RepID=UPI0036E66B6A